MDNKTDNIITDKPNGGFIPIYKRVDVKTHKPTSGTKKDIVSIFDIINKKYKISYTDK
jgi:hypothetical protein